MSFRIQSITRTATGREITREHVVAGDRITIGRDSRNDVDLADLAALPDHATITLSGAKLVIEALDDRGVNLNGKSRRHHEIRLGKPAQLRIGTHRLAIEPDPDGVRVIVRREEEAWDEDDQARAFSLAGRVPGKRLMAWASIAVITLLFLLWPIWSFYGQAPARLTAQQMRAGVHHADSSWSAGPLSRAHAALETNCKACHVDAFVAVPDKACAACHADIHEHADPRRLAAARAEINGWRAFQQRISAAFGKQSGRCVDCHVEHQGSVVLAAPGQPFCTACHGDLRARLPDTRLGDAGDFATSHPQFQPLVMVRPGATPELRRLSLDAKPREDSGLKFPHALHLSRSGGVAQMQATLGAAALDCGSCHVPDPSGVRFQPVSMERNCEGCHSLAFDRIGGTVRRLRHGDTEQVIADLLDHGRASPASSPFVVGMRRRPGPIGTDNYHGAGFSGPAAVQAIFSPGGACYDCHEVVRPPAGSLAWRVVPVRQPTRYLMHGWFDHSAHRSSQCADCHDAAHSTAASDVLVPGIATCRTCHGGADAATPKIRSSCTMCHEYHPGEGTPWALRRRTNADRRAAMPLRVDWGS